MNIAENIHPPAADAAPSLAGMVSLCEAAMRDVNKVILEKMASDVPLIPELAGHLIAAGGKRMRPMLTLMGALAGTTTQGKDDIPDEALYLAAAVEFIHNATLLHDDVIDQSEKRRVHEGQISGQKPHIAAFGEFLVDQQVHGTKR